MSNVCGNDDVDESAGVEDLEELDREGAEEWFHDDACDCPSCAGDDVEYYDEDERDYDPTDEEIYGDEVGREPSPLKRRYGFDLVLGVCSRPINVAWGMKGMPPRWESGVVRRFGQWRKHLYKKRGDRLVCRRCGEAWSDIPF